jgi:aminopeptidase N
MRTILPLFLTLSLAAQPPNPDRPNVSGGPLIEAQAAFDVRHYDLALAVDPERRRVDGALAMRARVVGPLTRVALDLDDRLKVEDVTVQGAAAQFEHRDGRVWIPLPAPLAAGDALELAVRYGGEPRTAPRPPWDGGFTWERTRSGKPWIATSCQGEGADLWWPCKDQPSDKPETMDLHVTVPGDLVCASNGTLAGERRNGDGTRTFDWHVANPISNYCVALNIGPYETIEDTYRSLAGDDVPVFFWALPESAARARKALPEFLDHLRFFEEVCGPYPFRNEKYGIAETPHLGMEHQTIIAYGNKFRRAQFDYDWLHHHELAHEWWANLVTCRDWKDMWIHEGIGTYMQALYLERRRGRKAYDIEMEKNRRVLNNRKAVAPRESQDSKQIYFGADGGHDNDIYYKGSWIVHTLRWVLGDETFFTVLRRWAYPDPEQEKVTDGTQVRFSDTEEIRSIAERVSGQELGWFFAVYLRQPDLPALEVDERDGVLALRWRVPGDLPFPMPVPLRIGEELQRIEMREGRARVTLPAGAEWAVDPGNLILKQGR